MVRCGRARGQYHGRGHFSAYTRSISSSSNEEALQSPSPIRSPLGDTMEFFPKDLFQSPHTETEYQETKQGNHSRQRDIPRIDRERDHDIDEEDKEVEILPEHIAKCRKDKNFQKVMEIILNEEKEKYFLKLAQEGARLPHHFDIKAIITPKEETETSKLQKQLKIMQDKWLK